MKASEEPSSKSSKRGRVPEQVSGALSGLKRFVDNGRSSSRGSSSGGSGTSESSDGDSTDGCCSREEYFHKALQRLGRNDFNVSHKHAFSTESQSSHRNDIRCVALSSTSNDSHPPPVFYNRTLINAMNEGPEMLRSVLSTKAYPNGGRAQNMSGVTILMRACQNVGMEQCSMLEVIRVLVDYGADPMVCCDSGRNVMHDLFWGSNTVEPSSSEDLEMRQVVRYFIESFGRDKIISLMMAPDNHSFTPLDYLGEHNWRPIVDTIVGFSQNSPPPSSSSSSSTAQTPTPTLWNTSMASSASKMDRLEHGIRTIDMRETRSMVYGHDSSEGSGDYSGSGSCNGNGDSNSNEDTNSISNESRESQLSSSSAEAMETARR